MTDYVAKKSPTTVTSDQLELEHHQIRLRAYKIYEERGREEGHALDHWLRAEEETTGRKVRGVRAVAA